MSEMEMATALLGQVPQNKLGFVIGYIQGLIADTAAGQEDVPNAETIAALKEGDDMLRSGKGQRFAGSTSEFFAMIDAEDGADA